MLIIIILITLVHARYVFVYTKTPCINRVDVFSSFYSHIYGSIMNEKRTESFILRLTEKEKEMLVSLANEHDMSISSYLRNMAFKGSAVTKTDIQTVIELKRIGNNINQIAKQINLIPHEDNIKLYLQELHDILNMLSVITKKLV